MKKCVCLVSAVALAAVSSSAADWPQWRGVDRIGVAAENIKGEWPEGGPKELWRITLGKGYSCPAVVGDRVYITGNVEVNGELRGFLYALEAATGKEIWSCDYGKEWSANYPMARTTPSVVGDKLVIISGMMEVICVSTDGKRLGGVDILSRFQGRNPRWGFAESPLVYDDKIICHPGGSDASVVALSLTNGETIWTSKGLSEGATYCSPMLLTLHGVRQVVTHTDSNLVGLDADTGAVLWKGAYRNNRGIQPNTPVLVGTDIIVVGCGYGHGSHAFRVTKNDGGVFSAVQIWENKDADNHFYGIVQHEGVLFSGGTRGGMSVIDPQTGRTLYRVEEMKSPALVKTSDRIIGYGERDGMVCLLEANAEKYTIKGKFPVTYGEGPHWAHPVVANGTLYIRHGAILAAYQVN